MSYNQIKAYFLNGDSNNYSIYSRPEECPICHFKIEPKYCTAYYSNDLGKNATVVWRCPRQSCFRLFISYYEGGQYQSSEPNYPKKIVVDENIFQISKRFCEIYEQALAAKSYRLPELVGMGLRKALEILIKDYCIWKQPDEVEKIKELKLASCINKYCDGHVKACAHKSRVLGNDESHYDKKYEDQDIDDLEKLIKATLHWIGAELIAESYSDLYDAKA